MLERRRQFLRDMWRDTRIRSSEDYRSESRSTCTQNTSFASQEPEQILEKPYHTSEGFVDSTNTCGGVCNSSRIVAHDPVGTLTDLQCISTSPGLDDISLRSPSRVTEDPHQFTKSTHQEVDLTGKCTARNFGSHTSDLLAEFIGPSPTLHPGGGMYRGKSSFDSSLWTEVDTGTADTTGLQERLHNSGLVQNVTGVELCDEIDLKATTKKDAVLSNTAFPSATMPPSDSACSIASFPAESSKTSRRFTPNSLPCPNSMLLMQENHEYTSDDRNKKSGLPIDSNGNTVNSFVPNGHLVESSKNRLMNPLGINTDSKDQSSNASRIESSFLSIQVELANEKRRNIEAERLIFSLNHEIETLRARNLALSAIPSVTSAGGELNQSAVSDVGIKGRTPTTYITELEQRISMITAALETKQSEIEAKDERIRLLEHTLANRLLSTVVPPAAAATGAALPPQSIAHTVTRGEVRAANIPDILSRAQVPGSASVVPNTKSSSLHDRNSFTEESKHPNKPCITAGSNRSGIEQSVDASRLPAPTLNLAGKSSERMPHPTIDTMRHASKTTPESAEGVELARLRNKVIEENIDSNKNKSDSTITKHQLALSPSPNTIARSQRGESMHKAEGSSVRGQRDTQSRLSSKKVRHPSVDLSNSRHFNSDSNSARASPRKPSVRKTPQRASTKSMNMLSDSSTVADSTHRSPVPGLRSSTATHTSFSYPFRMGVTTAPSLTASTASATVEHPTAAVSRQSLKPLRSMMRAWGRRGGSSPSPRGSPSLRSATSVNSRPRILFNEKDETTVMQGKTTTVVFRSSRTRHSTPLANSVDKTRAPLVGFVDRAALIPSVESEETETRDFVNH